MVSLAEGCAIMVFRVPGGAGEPTSTTVAGTGAASTLFNGSIRTAWTRKDVAGDRRLTYTSRAIGLSPDGFRGYGPHGETGSQPIATGVTAEPSAAVGRSRCGYAADVDMQPEAAGVMTQPLAAEGRMVTDRRRPGGLAAPDLQATPSSGRRD